MSAPAAAAYLATLAKLQGISHTRLDKLTGTGSRYLFRCSRVRLRSQPPQPCWQSRSTSGPNYGNCNRCCWTVKPM